MSDRGGYSAMAMGWIRSSEEECSRLWLEMPGLNSVFCGPGSQCLRKENKHEKVFSASLSSFFQLQNGNNKITQTHREAAKIVNSCP